MKRKLKVLLLSSFCLLSACHQGSFKGVPKEKQITHLLKASKSTEKQLGLFTPPGGGYYLSCMGSNEGNIDCQSFFNAMAHYLNASTEFKKAQLTDITDPSLFTAIALDYQMAFFNQTDEE
ncbi:hypothetical protein [Legionella micdadei]|uniref:Legionella vir region protein LvrD n=1 Tax=Legionella micdadei TaxID=451 RepID=A0A098GJN6_LEGMI|nr:hypothetical protein [Legionella micdadei]KTD28826.1 hypothetical protein Lmic_0746 [Legionella micdadei]CEG62202.1 Legionella vir region protein LvrD [Legionella micdadei]SCY07530.1 hypothetical protein SAMN02982997_00792 [Legionella micdadei]